MRTTNIKSCARCGKNHKGVEVMKFKSHFEKVANLALLTNEISWTNNDFPMAEYTHWANCPETNKPIFIKEVDE